MDFQNPAFYINRELSWLSFNERVIEEAQDKTNPILERLKFLAISASNLDEFYMVRVSGLMDQVIAEFSGRDHAGLTAEAQLKLIGEKTRSTFSKQYNCLNRSIVPVLEKAGIAFKELRELNALELEHLKRYFKNTIYPILTPMAIDKSRPFPLLNTKTLNIITELDRDGKSAYAVVQVPTVIPRIIELPKFADYSSDHERTFVFLEDVIKEYIDQLFCGYTVIGSAIFRIIRDSDLSIKEEDNQDLLYEIEKSVKRRKWGEPVRLDIERGMQQHARDFLQESFKLDDSDIFEIHGILDLSVWFGFYGMKGFDHLKNVTLPPIANIDFIDKNIFDVIRERDVLVHHPYESFECVLEFVRAAAADSDVLAIKQTLYRVSGDSPIVSALMQAAENGKQVTVLVELKARFDEENNIHWAKRLESSGCHVVYGLVGLKTHCKCCLVVRKEDDGIRRYVHMGTGNYNDSTARIYTDLGYFTCKETFGQDISSLFNLLTGFSTNIGFNKIFVAPTNLRDTFLKHILQETKNAQAGKDALIIAKMNSLVDTAIIESLYRASNAGVKIRLIVRGICCLRPGIAGVSENISVVSIIDRFLEHSRIFYFENGGNARVFLSSADWMPRNLDRRVEVLFPIDDLGLKLQVVEILNISLQDTVKLRVLQPDASYEKIDRRGKEHLQSQLIFYKNAKEKLLALEESLETSVFKPNL